jgi:alkanesulfonate monooxygenase SsuD/methylene tetrahydromethanopterin reductase-like flavin-dependent oxidoreductase (luciferase family)
MAAHVAASSPGAGDWAAGRGLYREGLAYQGHDAAGRETPMGRLVAVADTDAEAEAIARRGAKWTAGAYIPKQALAQFRQDDAEIDPVDHYLSDVVVHGCPERVVDELLRLEEEIPLAYLLLSPLSERTFGLFTDRVLPHVAG